MIYRPRLTMLVGAGASMGYGVPGVLALTKELKLTFAKAEHLKRNAAKSPELAQILKALRPVLSDFVGEVPELQNSLRR